MFLCLCRFLGIFIRQDFCPGTRSVGTGYELCKLSEKEYLFVSVCVDFYSIKNRYSFVQVILVFLKCNTVDTGICYGFITNDKVFAVE